VTLFASILDGLGLSQSEAADFLGVRLDTVKNWSSGRRPTPDGVWPDLHKLARQQIKAAEAAVKLAAKILPETEIELGLANDDAEAQALGWPCVGAQMAAFRRAWEMLGPDAVVKIIPRGSTESSRAAIKARQSR
jgi:hypothetical protein